jgi:hypothetical protein
MANVTLSLFAGAGAQFLDNSGNVLTGGLIYTYAAGTTTPLATYTSNLGTTAHANPIVLDASGRVPGGEIWVVFGSTYKFVLKDTNNVLIATYDNITGNQVPLTTTNITYTAPFTNAVSETLTTKLSESVSVKDFGAKGDGTTDDTTAIQNCINNTPAKTNIYFPPGTYYIKGVSSTSVFQLKQGQHLIGSGIGSTIIKVANITLSPQGQSIFYIANNDCGIFNMSFDGGGLATIQNMILTNNVYRPSFNNLYLYNLGTNYAAFRLQNSYYGSVNNIQIDAYTGTLTSPTIKSHGLWFENTTKEPTYHKVSNININGGYFGVSIWNQEYSVFDNLIVSDYYPQSNGNSGDGINFSNSSYCAVTNATLIGRTDGGLVIYTQSLTQVPEYNVFSNITSNWNTLEGIYFSAGRNNQFSNIMCANNAQGSRATYGNRYGIYINVDSANITQENTFVGITASDTQSTPTQAYGIYLTSGVANTRFFNVVATGNAFGQYQDLATSTTMFIIDNTTYRSLFNYGISIPNGGNQDAGFYGQNVAGVDKKILTVKNTASLTDATIIQSAGGGVEFTKSDGTTSLGYLDNNGVWNILYSGVLKQLSFGAANSGGAGYRTLIIPN